MGAAIDDVHHRHRQRMGEGSADIAVELQAGVLGGGLGHRQRDAENGVGAEPPLVRRAVQFDHRAVDVQLVLGIHARQRVIDLAVDRLDRLQHALAAVAGLVAVAQFDRLVGSGRRARTAPRPGRRRRTPDGIDLDGRIAAGIEDLAGMDIGNGSHRLTLPFIEFRRCQWACFWPTGRTPPGWR